MAEGARAARSVGIISAGPEVASKRFHNAITIGVPVIGTIATVILVPPLTTTTAVLFLLFFVSGGIGAGIGLHRYFAHRAFVARPSMRWVLGVLASWAWQGPIVQWVSDHRRHHRFSDTPLDPHSPHFVNGEPPASLAAGLFHAHYAWMVLGDVSEPRRYAADVLNDHASRWCSENYWFLASIGLIAPAALGWLLGGAGEAVSCMAWAGFVRIAVIQNSTWAIASIGHSFGTRLPDCKDEARDNVLLAVLMLGEGLHSYHHTHPGSALNSPSILDANGWILRLWERLGLIHGLKRG